MIDSMVRRSSSKPPWVVLAVAAPRRAPRLDVRQPERRDLGAEVLLHLDHVTPLCRTIAPCGATSAQCPRTPCPRIGQEIGLLDCPTERVDSLRKVRGGARRIAGLSSVYDRRAELSRRDVRVDDRAVALDDLLNAAPLQLPRDRRAVEAQHPRDIFPGLGIWRDTPERPHPLLPRGVRPDGGRPIVAGPPPEAAPLEGAPPAVCA